MNEWKKVKLGEVLKEVNERNKGEKVKRVLSVTNSRGFVSQEEYFEGTVHSANISNYKIVRKNQFAYNPSRVNVGSIDILKDYEYGALSPMYIVFEVDTTKLLPDYFKYYFETNRFFENVKNNTQGSVRNSLSFKALADFDYLLPPIEEQEKIVKILKNVDSIIQKYINVLEEKDNFIKSQFVDMLENKEFEEKTLDEISIISGEYGSNVSAMEYDETLPRYVRITDITENGKLNKNSFASPKNETNIDKYLLQYGDILFARTGATVGKTYLYEESDGNCIYAGYCIRFRLNTKIVNPEYIFRYTQTRQYLKWVDIVKRGGAQPNINSKQYGSITIPIPPMELQNKFAEIVKQVDKQKLLLEQQKQNYENLKRGLMQKLLTGKVKVNV